MRYELLLVQICTSYELIQYTMYLRRCVQYSGYFEIVGPREFTSSWHSAKKGANMQHLSIHLIRRFLCDIIPSR